ALTPSKSGARSESPKSRGRGVSSPPLRISAFRGSGHWSCATLDPGGTRRRRVLQGFAVTIFAFLVPNLRNRPCSPNSHSADRLQLVMRASNVVRWHSPCPVSRTRLVTEPQRPRALVVDDFDGVREAVRLMLDALGYEAEGAASGADAL